MKIAHSSPLRLAPHARALAALAGGVALACGSAGPAPSSTDGGLTLGTAIYRVCESELARMPSRPGSALRAERGGGAKGVCQNGLTVVPLGGDALDSPEFAAWFNADPGSADVVMRYTFSCAAPAGQTVTWTNPATGAAYAWRGRLALAPGWTSGAEPTEAEQQVVSACLAALVNKYGAHVTIALEGRGATGEQIPVGATELETFSVREGCFFGNVFAGDGLFVGADHAPYDDATSSSRACTFDRASGPDGDCPPLVSVGSCADLCEPDATGVFYERCTVGGKAYQAIATRVAPSTLFRCGDGVCQFTERCGTGSTWNDCEADCGACP